MTCKYGNQGMHVMNCRACTRSNQDNSTCAALCRIENGFAKHFWGNLSLQEKQFIISYMQHPKNIVVLDQLYTEEEYRTKFNQFWDEYDNSIGGGK